jgi:Protein of unknown function (DUF1812).
MAGCDLSDDLRKPEATAELTFEYTHNNSGNDLFAQQVKKVTALVFDSKGKYVASFTGAGSELASPGYRMKLGLPEGSYTVQVWGGTLETYLLGTYDKGVGNIQEGLVAGSSMEENLRVSTKKSGDGPEGIPTAMPPVDLFYGKTRIVVNAYKPATAKVSLMKNSSTLRFIIKKKDTGTRRAADGNETYEVVCTGNNTVLDANNGMSAQAVTMRYLPSDYGNNGSVSEASVRMNRLFVGKEVNALVRDKESGKVLLDCDLVAMILDTEKYNNQQDIDREDLFEIEIMIDEYDMNVTVKVNGWNIVNIDPIPEA